MTKRYSCKEVNQLLNKEISHGRPILVVGAGTGISAKFAERGGADLIGVYNSGKYRMDGHGSLAGLMPYGDANALVLELGSRTVLPIVQHAPVIAGICGTDPTRCMDVFLKELINNNFSGVMNFPTVGLIDADSRFRKELEETGMGYQREIEALKLARDLGLFTMGYAFTPEEGRLIGEAGLDVVIAHMGLTRGGSIGSKQSPREKLTQSVELVNEIGKQARKVNANILLFAHGGPIAEPADTQFIYDNTDAVGFLGASSAERIPIERPLQETAQAFKAARIKVKQ